MLGNGGTRQRNSGATHAALETMSQKASPGDERDPHRTGSKESSEKDQALLHNRFLSNSNGFGMFVKDLPMIGRESSRSTSNSSLKLTRVHSFV